MAWKQVIDTVVVGACGPAGGGRHEMSQRLTRHMLALAVPAAGEVAMRGICSAVLGGFMDAYFTPGGVVGHMHRLAVLFLMCSTASSPKGQDSHKLHAYDVCTKVQAYCVHM
jgi:hypothetical protein